MPLTQNFFRFIEITALSVSALTTILIMFYSSDFKVYLDFFYAWAILPYLSFYIISVYAHKRKFEPVLPLATCITSVLMLMFTMLVYIDGIFIHTSSTSALLFLFVPFWLFIGGPFVLAILLGILRLLKK
jgi:hypothetical protein